MGCSYDGSGHLAFMLWAALWDEGRGFWNFAQEKLPSAQLRDLLWGLGRPMRAMQTVEVKPLFYWGNGCLLARAEKNQRQSLLGSASRGHHTEAVA